MSQYQTLKPAKMSNEESELIKLVFEVFGSSESGKKLLILMHKNAMEHVSLPTNPQIISQFGTVEAYLAFMDGKRSVIQEIDRLLQMNKDMPSLIIK